MQRRLKVFLAIVLLLSLSFAGYIYLGEVDLRSRSADVLSSLSAEPMRTALGISVFVVGAFVFYKLAAKAIRVAIVPAHGTEADVMMLLGLWRFVVVFICALIVLGVFLQLGIISAILGAFGGMFLGWSLQAPISGFAAWLLVTLRRPFRVGDRVQLPSQGLVGDVLNIGPMYTVLNQVGGAVGSEEAVGRHILIPNSMLFGNLMINYTPRRQKQDAGAPRPESESPSALESAYILDEVVTRITYDSDWNTAESILLNAAKEVTIDIIEETGQEPYIRADMYDYGIWMRLRYMTLATDRPRISYEIVKRVSKAFSENDTVDFAIPYVYSSKRGKDSAIHSTKSQGHRKRRG